MNYVNDMIDYGYKWKYYIFYDIFGVNNVAYKWLCVSVSIDIVGQCNVLLFV